MESNLRTKLFGEPITLRDKIQKLVDDARIDGTPKDAPTLKVPKEPGEKP